MTPQDQYRALDELAGGSQDWFQYNAIIPLIHKLAVTYEMIRFAQSHNILDTPAELCESLLRAVEKWKE